jgi:hypothetical protein
MARGNKNRRALIHELGLVGQAEGISTKSLLSTQAELAAIEAAKPKRRTRKATV